MRPAPASPTHRHANERKFHDRHHRHPVTTTANDAFLRFAMRLDAVLSGLIGIARTPRSPPGSPRCPAPPPRLEYSMGAFFVAYGVAVFALSR